MENEKYRKRQLKILDQAPDLKKIMLSKASLAEKKAKIRTLLSETLVAVFSDNPAIAPLEWLMTRDAITVFRNMLSERNERLAGYSFLQYLDDLLHSDTIGAVPAPNSGFFAELEHLLKGISGKAGIYSDKVSAFQKYEGQKAARLRSADLSRMSRSADAFMDRYPTLSLIHI